MEPGGQHGSNRLEPETGLLTSVKLRVSLSSCQLLQLTGPTFCLVGVQPRQIKNTLQAIPLRISRARFKEFQRPEGLDPFLATISHRRVEAFGGVLGLEGLVVNQTCYSL